MKAIVFLLSVTLFFSCSKDSSNRISNASVQGKWQYLYSVGGFTGNDSIFPLNKAEVILQLNLDYTYSITTNDAVTKQGSYDIIKAKTIFSEDLLPVMRFDDFSKEYGLVVEHNEPMLMLEDNVYEPYTAFYKRLK